MKIEQLLKNSGHSKLLPLQEATIEAFQQHNHVQLLAQTGSGKTYTMEGPDTHLMFDQKN